MPGPYYLAYIDGNETVFDGSHIREDEEVLGYTIKHDEADFPSLIAEIINPRVGLLGPGRNQWVFFSEDVNYGKGAPDVRPLFRGRLIAIPDDLDEGTITIEFTARPQFYDDIKAAVAEGYKVRPYWDPLWFSPDTLDDPDNILESRGADWHISRLGDVSISSIVRGEDGVLDFGPDKIIDGSVHVRKGEAPLTRVEMTMTVSWNQVASGIVVDLSSKMFFGAPYSILTYTGAGLQQNWPASGDNMGGGWSVLEGKAVRTDGVGDAVWGYGLRNTPGAAGFGGTQPFGRSYVASENFHDVIVPAWATASSFVGGGTDVEFPAHILGLPRWRLIPTLRVALNVSRQRQETLTFELTSDVQAVVTDPGDDAVVRIALQSSELMTDLDPADDSGGMQMPIRTLHARSYFPTDRGEQSIEYGLCIAAATLEARARCVDVDFEVPYDDGILAELSCRKSVIVRDPDLPGGYAEGKISSYQLHVDGDTGDRTCEITASCSVGKGTGYVASPGVGTYASPGYMAPGYQRMEGKLNDPLEGQVIYESINGIPPNDDGVDFDTLTADRIITRLDKTGSYTEQEAAMGTSADEPNDVFDRLNAVQTAFSMDLIDLSKGNFLTAYALATSGLAIHRGIDLEAGDIT